MPQVLTAARTTQLNREAGWQGMHAGAWLRNFSPPLLLRLPLLCVFLLFRRIVFLHTPGFRAFLIALVFKGVEQWHHNAVRHRGELNLAARQLNRSFRHRSSFSKRSFDVERWEDYRKNIWSPSIITLGSFQPSIESRKTSQQPPAETYPAISSGDTRRTWASSTQRSANLIPLDIPQNLGTPSSAMTNQTFRQLEQGTHRYTSQSASHKF